MCDRELFKALCVYLKGQVVGYAVRNGMIHNSKRVPSEEFLAGYGWFEEWNRTGVIVCHIYYNWLRHDRSHTGSIESDVKFLTSHNYAARLFLKNIRNRFGDIGVELLEKGVTA